MQSQITKTVSDLQDPFYFVSEVLGVTYLTPSQKEIIKSVWLNDYTGVKSSPGMGKTFIAACITLAFLIPNENSKVVTTATTGKQVEKLLWSEIASLYAKSKYPLGGKLTTTDLQISKEWFATGISPQVGKEEESADRLRGYHAPKILVVVDEASGVKSPVLEAVEDITSNEFFRVLMISNPVTRSSGFYKFCKAESTNAITMDCFSHPNIIENREVVPGSISSKWVRSQIKKHCDIVPEHDKSRNTFEFDGNIYLPNNVAIWRLLAQFPGLGADTLIPYTAIEDAMSREPNTVSEPYVHIALDVARFGDDESVFCINENENYSFKAFYHFDTTKLAGQAIEYIKQYKPVKFSVDCDGIGAGVYDVINEYITENNIEVELIELHSGSEPLDLGQQEQFLNKRAQMFWTLKNDINTISLEQNEELLDGLSSIKYFYNSKGKIQIEEKKDFKARLGRSSDYEDALAYCNFVKHEEAPTVHAAFF